MSLLLALTDTGGGGVTGTVATRQAQTIAASASVAVAAVTASGSTSQGQTVSGTGTANAASVSGTITTKQGQTSAGTGVVSAASINGVITTSQAQTAALSGSVVNIAAVSGVVSTSQSQTATGTSEFAGLSPSGEVILTRKKIYVKRGKQYLIFNNNQEADAYLAAEQAIETAKKSSRGAVKRVIKALKVVKPEIVEAPKLEAIETLLARFNVQFDAIQAQKNNDIEALIAIQSMLYELQQDEEDIELLLLAV